MKNLKKLNRNSQKEILGGVRNGGIQKCEYHFECPGGSCCRNACMYAPCPEL